MLHLHGNMRKGERLRKLKPQLPWRKSTENICQAHAYKAKQSQGLTDLTSKDTISHL